MRPRAAKSETQVQGAKLDVLEKEKSGATVAANAGKGKQNQAGECDQHGQRKIHLAGRDSTQSRRPSPIGCGESSRPGRMSTILRLITNCTRQVAACGDKSVLVAVRPWSSRDQSVSQATAAPANAPIRAPNARNWSPRQLPREADQERRLNRCLRAASPSASAATGSRLEALR